MTAVYEGPQLDVDALVAVDMHTHVHVSSDGHGGSAVLESMAEYFRSSDVTPHSVNSLAAYYRERKMAAVTFTVDTMAFNGEDLLPTNEEVCEAAARNRDVIIPFVSIDPARGQAGVRAARRLIEEYGARGFKFHPSAQGFRPDDRLAYPLYELIQEHQLPAIFHSGQTGVGAGTRGGGGIRLGLSNPIHLDDVAVDFPDLTIILAHPSFPWQEEALAVATHKPRVHLDLSGWSPKYFPPILIQYVNTMLKDKVMFGSDFPVITPERWIAAAQPAGIRESVLPGLLKDNALRLLGIGGA